MDNALLTLLTLAGRLRDRLAREEGQTAAEYIGVIVVLAAVIAVVVTFNTDIGEAIRDGVVNAIGRMTD